MAQISVRAWGSPGVDLLGGVDGHEAGRLQVHVAVGHEALHELLVLQQAAVHLSGQHALDHQVEGPPHLPDRVHAVEDAAGTEPVLGGAVAVAHLAQHVLRRHPDVVVADLAVVRGRAAPDADAAHDGDPGGRGGHDDLHHAARPVVLGRLGGPAHDDEEVGRQPVGGEPLVPVDDPLVALAHGAWCWMERGSEPAFSGSVMENPDCMVPSTRGSSHFSFCSSVPYLARMVWLPELGATTPKSEAAPDGVGQDLVHVGVGHEVDAHAAVLGRQVRGPQPLGLDPGPGSCAAAPWPRARSSSVTLPRRRFHRAASLGRISSLTIRAVRIRMSLMWSLSPAMGVTVMGMVRDLVSSGWSWPNLRRNRPMDPGRWPSARSGPARSGPARRS